VRKLKKVVMWDGAGLDHTREGSLGAKLLAELQVAWVH